MRQEVITGTHQTKGLLRGQEVTIGLICPVTHGPSRSRLEPGLLGCSDFMDVAIPAEASSSNPSGSSMSHPSSISDPTPSKPCAPFPKRLLFLSPSVILGEGRVCEQPFPSLTTARAMTHFRTLKTLMMASGASQRGDPSPGEFLHPSTYKGMDPSMVECPSPCR